MHVARSRCYCPIVLLKITDVVVGVRASEEQEIEGLDLTEHGEEAYNLEM
ncbi:MAG: ammonium transporter [Acidobacteria bacterium]|nr:ammonium transporter [Acidobacteriota bacterium]